MDCKPQTSVEDKGAGHLVSAINCYFMCQDGSMFQANLRYAPYFFLQIKVRPRRITISTLPEKRRAAV